MSKEPLPSISPPVMDASAARALIAANQEVGFDPPPIAVASAEADAKPAAKPAAKSAEPKTPTPPAAPAGESE